jgi:hypothetical protein
MKGKYLKMRERSPRHVYTVHGTAKEIADFIEKQGENCRFLQSDGSISPDETATPVVYQFKMKGNTPTLRWNAEYENWDADIHWMDAMVLDRFLSDAEGVTSNRDTTDESEEEEEVIATKPKAIVKRKVK